VQTKGIFQILGGSKRTGCPVLWSYQDASKKILVATEILSFAFELFTGGRYSKGMT